MDVRAFLKELCTDPAYAEQIVHIHEEPAREAVCADPELPLSLPMRRYLDAARIEHLYRHQADAINAYRGGRDSVIATGTASGKTLGYVLPLIDALSATPDARALLLYPAKALCQDQFRKISAGLADAGLGNRLCGVFDGDTPTTLRRRLRDRGTVIFSNPDMVHAAILPQHARWAEFLSNLSLLVLDELHVYSGIFGSNMALLLERLFRLCRHYGSQPRIVACSATIANPRELAEKLTGHPFEAVTRDGSPRGRRTYVFWNPPRIRAGDWRSRRSANVEAHELMARLVARGVPTITFSKAKMTAEMIHRYVVARLREIAPALAASVTPYRGGYLPAERREIEERLFRGELLGVSSTRALELGIDVGNLEASIVVGYPGTLASFFQQAGRAGRKLDDSVAFLIGLDTSINQYIMSHPEYIFERCIEQAVIDPHNPFIVTGHLRCATHELALPAEEARAFGPDAPMVLELLQENKKVRRIADVWYHAAPEIPQHEISLRDTSNANVIVEDADTGAVLGEVDRFDAPPILHPHAVYMHRGDTYVVRTLDLERNIATVRREDVDYYTQALGGTDVHHIDHQLREKPFGRGRVFWGEVTAYFRTYAFEKVRFYTLDAFAVEGLDLPTMALETMAFWIVPDESILEQVRRDGLDAHSGLRGIGYAVRMLLPLFMTCDTLDFSHTVGSINSPWQAIFVYERYPHGLGFTETAYEKMDAILPAVLDAVVHCPCESGCPCCVGKPLRQYATWNVERGEASIPSKAAALAILRALLDDRTALRAPDTHDLTDSPDARATRLERAVRRRLERMREPQVFHPITPPTGVETAYPSRERDDALPRADSDRRAERRRDFERDLHKRIATRVGLDGLKPLAGKPPPPAGMKHKDSNLRPTAFAGRPAQPPDTSKNNPAAPDPAAAARVVTAGDSLAARARRRMRNQPEPPRDDGAS